MPNRMNCAASDLSAPASFMICAPPSLFARLPFGGQRLMPIAEVEKKRNVYAGSSGGALRISGPALALVRRPVLARLRGLADLRSPGADPGLLARRHRRQYADDAGSRPARRPGLVRSPAAPPGRLQHSLVAPGRPADRGAEAPVRTVFRGQDRGDDRGHGRAAAADAGGDVGGGLDDAAAGLALRLPARHHHARLQRIDRRHVVPAAARSSRLAARLPRLGRRRFDRSQAAARRPHARHRDRLVADHRA